MKCKKRKKILIVLPSDEIGGAEHVLMNIAKFYIDNNDDVHVYFLQKEKTRKWRDLESAKLYFSKSSNTLGGVWWFSKIIYRQKEQYDFVFSSLIHINALLSILAKLNILKKKYLIVRESTSIYTRFSFPKLVLYDSLYRFFYTRSIDLIVCQTDIMKRQLLTGCSWLNKIRCEVIPNPINLSYMKNMAKLDKGLINDGKKYIISIGRLNHVKRFDRLIDAYSVFSLRNEYDLLILGDGPEKTSLQRLISKLGLGNNIKLLGFKNNVYPYIKQAEFGVISSDIEGFPNVLLQMYALNLKVVITKCCGGLEEVPNLFIAKDMSPESLAYNMESIVKDKRESDFHEFISRYDVSYFIRKLELLLE